MKYQRVHIFGGPGSGKTYAGKRVAECLGYRHYDLDNVFFMDDDEDYTRINPDDVRDEKLLDIVGGDSWVVEGSFTKWVQPSVDRADIVVIVSPNSFLRAIRIVRRFLKGRLGMISRKYEGLKNLTLLLKWNFKYERTNNPRIEERIKDYRGEVKRFTTADDAIRYLCQRSSS